MINDPNYNLPKDAFIRLFDNPIPAGDPARAQAPEWAQELDEVVVWAHMGDNGQVSVKVNGEDIGGGGGLSYAEVSFTPAVIAGDNLEVALPVTWDYETVECDRLICATSGSSDPSVFDVVIPTIISVPFDLIVSDSSTGSYTFSSTSHQLTVTGPANIIFEVA